MNNQETKALWIGGPILGTTVKKDGESDVELYSNNVKNLRESNFTDLFIWSGMNTDKVEVKDTTKFYLQIGGVNCVYYDIERNDVYWNDECPNVDKLIEQIKAILEPGGSITKVHIMLGGGSYTDKSGVTHYNKTFRNLQVLIDPKEAPILPHGFNTDYAGITASSIINRMFKLLKKNIGEITGVQYDDEHWYHLDTTNLFSEMLLSSEFGYSLSYIPAWGPNDYWNKSIQKFYDQIDAIYIQTYSGATLDQWHEKFDKSIWYLFRPVFEEKYNNSYDTPARVKEKMSGYTGLTGAGIWLYDDFAENRLKGTNAGATVQDYAAALDITN